MSLRIVEDPKPAFLGAGLHYGVSHDVYHADPCERPSLSAHVAAELVKHSPGHAWKIHPRLGGLYVKRSSDAMDTGTILHGMLLGSGPEIVAVDANDWRTNKAKAEREAAEAEGKVAMLSGKLEVLKVAADEIRRSLPMELSEAKKEVTAIWESCGATCRARIDSLHGDWWIWDLKFCDDATVSAAERNIAGNNYHVQAASNIDAIETLCPESAGRVHFGLCFVEWENPKIGVMRREIRGQLLDVGKQRWNRAKTTWAQCLASNDFPGYSTEIVEAKCPAWIAGDEFDAQVASLPAPF